MHLPIAVSYICIQYWYCNHASSKCSIINMLSILLHPSCIYQARCFNYSAIMRLTRHTNHAYTNRTSSTMHQYCHINHAYTDFIIQTCIYQAQYHSYAFRLATSIVHISITILQVCIKYASNLPHNSWIYQAPFSAIDQSWYTNHAHINRASSTMHQYWYINHAYINRDS